MVSRLAEVLRVSDLTQLLGEDVPTAVYAHPAHNALARVQRALAAWSPESAGGTPDLADLRRRVESAWLLRSVSSTDRSDLAAVLPDLLADGQRCARSTQRQEAYQLLAEVYHLSQLYLCYQPAPELLWVVVDRGMSAAHASGDAATLARAAWFAAYLYRDSGVLDLAHQVVDDALRYLAVAGDRSPTVERQRCVVHLAAAWNHARDGHAAQAWREWDAAVDADTGAQPVSAHALFGARCDDVALTLDVELGRAASALRRAAATDVNAIASVPRRTRVMIEAARGYLLKNEHTGAVHLLQRAQRTSPEATLYSMHARSMVHGMSRSAPPMLRAEVDQLVSALRIG
jgi:hypothetical protein